MDRVFSQCADLTIAGPSFKYEHAEPETSVCSIKKKKGGGQAALKKKITLQWKLLEG